MSTSSAHRVCDTSPAVTALPVLEASHWRTRKKTHESRIDTLLADHPIQLPNAQPHPVWQFLFRYYNFTPNRLRRWHPGYGAALADAPEYAPIPHYRRTSSGAYTLSTSRLVDRHATIDHIHRLMVATASRPAMLNCFGLHEWAMVYRASPHRRHATALRLSPEATDEVIQAHTLRCTHVDAFRFFTDDAAPLNLSTPTRATQVDDDQPGCVHAGMDLYKWSGKLEALVPSELIADALDLAFDYRELDMRASPYDLADLGFPPITIETPRGRAQYVRHQTLLGKRAAQIRQRLIDECTRLLSQPG